jgi:hypothetical protein
MIAHARVLAFGMIVGVAGPAAAWVATLPGAPDDDAAAYGVAADASGDVVAAGTLPHGGSTWLGVAKFDGASGAKDWDTTAFAGHAAGVVVLSGGDVFAAGTYERFFDGIYVGSIFGTASLDGTTGDVTSPPPSLGAPSSFLTGAVAIPPSSPVVFGTDGRLYVSRVGSWEQHVSAFEMDGTAGPGHAFDAVVDANGDVLVTGVTYSLKASPRPDRPPVADVAHLVVAKLDGDDGTVLWQYVLSDTSQGSALALDADGNVVVGGVAASTTGGTIADDMFVAKVDSSGSEVWSRTIDGGADSPFDEALDVAADAAGDVIVTGRLAISPNDPLFYGGLAEFAVLKLAGADGAEQWRYLAPNTTLVDAYVISGTKGEGRAIVFDPQDGEPVVAGATNASWIESGVSGDIADFTVVKLSSATGAQQELWVPGAGFAYAATATADGVVAAGRLNRVIGDGSTVRDFAVVKLVDGIAGTRVALRDGDEPARRRLKLSSKDRGVTSPLAGRYGDPTFDGGHLVLVDPATAAEQAIDLPAAGWRVISGGYEYRDQLGTCPLVQIRRNRGVVAKCAGAEVHLPTARATRGNLGVRVEIGPTRAAEYCTEFGGVVQRDDGESFRAKAAPAPARCRAE